MNLTNIRDLEDRISKFEKKEKYLVNFLHNNANIGPHGRIAVKYKDDIKLPSPLDMLFSRAPDNTLFSRGPLYVSAQRIPESDEEKFEIPKRWIAELRWYVETVEEVLLRKQCSILLGFVTLEHLIESSAFLFLKTHRTIEKSQKRKDKSKRIPAVSILPYINLVSYSSEAMFQLLHAIANGDSSYEKLENKLKKVKHTIQNISSSNVLKEISQEFSIENGWINRFWRPREGQNEIRNYLFADELGSLPRILDYNPDMVVSIIYGSISMMGHVISGLRELADISSIPAIVVYSKNETIMGKDRKINEKILKEFSYVFHLWGHSRRPLLVIDDSIGTGKTLKGALSILLYLTREIPIEELQYKTPKEVIKYARREDIYSAVESLNVHNINDKNYLRLLGVLILPPIFPIISSKLQIRYARQLFRSVGVESKVKKTEFNVSIQNKDKYREFKKRYLDEIVSSYL